MCATNAQADQYNKVEFEKIKERVQVKCAVVKGTFDTKKPPVEQRMELKVGQKVMLAVNDTDSPNGEKKLRFYNGSLAIIKKIGRNSIYVDIEKTGETVEIVRHEWKQMKKTFHYRLRKNLTRRKFTGTQMQNIGIGAHLLPIPR